MVELAVCIIKQSANRIFGLILNSYNVMCNHNQVIFFFPKILAYNQNSSLKGFHNILSHIQDDKQPETQLTNSCHTCNQISFKYI